MDYLVSRGLIFSGNFRPPFSGSVKVKPVQLSLHCNFIFVLKSNIEMLGFSSFFFSKFEKPSIFQFVNPVKNTRELHVLRIK